MLGSLEAEVMLLAWSAAEPLSVRAMLGRLNEGRTPPLAYTTVMTMMARLAEKEILRRRMNGRGYVYKPSASLGSSRGPSCASTADEHSGGHTELDELAAPEVAAAAST